MSMKRFILAALFALITSDVSAQSVQQSGAVTRNHNTIWNSNGVVQDGGSAADSPLSTLGVNGQFCVMSDRATAVGRNLLCFQASTSGAATISLQNYGTAAAQALNFVINGTTFPFPGSLANITIGVTPVVGGTNSLCLFVSGGVVGQQACTLSAITSLTGDVTATGPGVSAATLATVNSNVGTWGSGSQVPIFTINGKGLITSASQTSIALAVGSTTIASGSTNGMLYNNGGVLGNLLSANNGVLVTSAGGVPSISTTLPSGLSIGSPTFTGTMTLPDASTWTNVGISKVVALSVGSATLPSSGNVSISGQYQINGSQIAASNLSNGTTGSGAVVLAAGPSISGTWAGNATFSGNLTLSGNDTFSAQLIATGTSPPASAGGNSVVMGTIAVPTLTNTGQAFLFNTVVNGANLEGDGSTNDVSILNKSGGLVFGVPTGTTKLNFPSLSAGTCSSGLALDSGNNTVLTSCPGAASSIQVGATSVTSGTDGSCLLNVGGTLQNQPCASEPQGRITLTANTPVMTATASAQTTLRYDCYIGRQVPYFDGTRDQIDTIASCEVTDAMVSAASAGQVVSANVYDVWWVHGGANRICLAMSASTGGGGGWSADVAGSNTARGTGYTQLDRITRGYTTNKNAITNCFNGATNYGSVGANQGTYLGTVYASANGQISWTLGASASGGTAGLLGVWNMYGRVTVGTTVTDSGTSYAYALATIRQARGSAGNQVQFVTGLAEDSPQTSYGFSGAWAAVINANMTLGIGLDVAASFTSTGLLLQAPSNDGAAVSGSSVLFATPQIGLHTISANEKSDGVNGSTFDSTAANQLTFSLRM